LKWQERMSYYEISPPHPANADRSASPASPARDATGFCSMRAGRTPQRGPARLRNISGPGCAKAISGVCGDGSAVRKTQERRRVRMQEGKTPGRRRVREDN
jgi:hypothetical protein